MKLPVRIISLLGITMSLLLSSLVAFASDDHHQTAGGGGSPPSGIDGGPGIPLPGTPPSVAAAKSVIGKPSGTDGNVKNGNVNNMPKVKSGQANSYKLLVPAHQRPFAMNGMSNSPVSVKFTLDAAVEKFNSLIGK